ncbi:MAG: SAM-dependent methyltransferase [Gammaproteobacteria bacterium]|nr:SAM-dependent methyltransferase [Gammaproteobacteria bacterium]
MPKTSTGTTTPDINANQVNDSFPKASPESQTHSDRLKHKIQSEIANKGDKITFADYMNMALYAPGLGYYSAGLKKFGKQGDFITAPEISPLFSQCLALQCIHIMEQTKQKTLLEVGAGSGVMAVELVLELERQSQLPEHYFILELSADLRDRQQQIIKTRLPHLYDRFQWLNCLPEKPFDGIIIANELLDAMPVHLIKLEQDSIYERYVSLNDEGDFIWKDDVPENPNLLKAAQKIQILQKSLSHLKDKPDASYITEVNLQAVDWIKSIADILGSGAVLLVDYGYTAQEYYHPQRSMGTLMCHYQHHRHDDPFYLPGLQDITAHIDFSSIAHAANDSGLSICGFTTQAHFLMAGGLVELTQDLNPNDVLNFTEVARQIKMLTLPEEMGELFKVILLAKGKKLSLPAFQFQNFQNRL